MAPFGITILRNDILEVEGLQIARLDDLWASRFRPELALGRPDPGRAAVVLSHNPDTVDLPGWNGYEGWVLSGTCSRCPSTSDRRSRCSRAGA